MSICLSEWLKHLHKEYLDEYIPQGGAAVKVAVVPTEDTETTRTAILESAYTRHYFVANVNAGATKAHMIQEVYFAIARQVDWRGDIECHLRLLLSNSGIHVGEEQALDDLDGIAEANGRSREDILGEIKRLIYRKVQQNYQFCREFRTAMTRLSYAAVDPQSVDTEDVEVLMQWLKGEPVNLAALKRLQIFQKVGRQNARLMIRSLSAWLHTVGHEGTMLVLDLNAILAERSTTDVQIRYTRSAVLDAYDLLRTFIDDTDELSYLLLVVLIGPGFESNSKLGLDNYTALKMRLVNDVRGRECDNPLNAMVTLKLCDGEGDADADTDR